MFLGISKFRFLKNKKTNFLGTLKILIVRNLSETFIIALFLPIFYALFILRLWWKGTFRVLIRYETLYRWICTIYNISQNLSLIFHILIEIKSMIPIPNWDLNILMVLSDNVTRLSTNDLLVRSQVWFHSHGESTNTLLL